MSVYLTIGADKICRDHDCPASEFSMLLGYAHFKDSITRDDTINYVRKGLPMAPLMEDPDASWSYADWVMNILAITPHASGLQHPLSSPITLDTYHSWEEEVLALAKKQSTEITQEQLNSWVSSRTITRELSMLEFVQTQRSYRTGRVCLFVGEDYHSLEPAKEYLQERLREMDGDPFKIGDATFADRKAKDDFDIFSVRLIEQLLPLPKVGKEGKYTAPSALGKSRAQLKEERDAVLAPIRKALMDRVEELKGVEWRVAGAEKSLDHWAYLYQLMTYLHEKEIVSQQTFERWEGEVAERVKVLEKEKMKKNLDNKKLYDKTKKQSRPDEGSKHLDRPYEYKPRPPKSGMGV
ncbi:hypothetical protein F5880DRAFT_94102 [Lentinula raphanica]|nr:hypothetical protein F5880DRAFT_94102 [Lentinula raphanica]